MLFKLQALGASYFLDSVDKLKPRSPRNRAFAGCLFLSQLHDHAQKAQKVIWGGLCFSVPRGGSLVVGVSRAAARLAHHVDGLPLPNEQAARPCSR